MGLTYWEEEAAVGMEEADTVITPPPHDAGGEDVEYCKDYTRDQGCELEHDGDDESSVGAGDDGGHDGPEYSPTRTLVIVISHSGEQDRGEGGDDGDELHPGPEPSPGGWLAEHLQHRTEQ